MYNISHPDKSLTGTIDLTSSKSISNRLLIIQALCKELFEIQRLSTAQDTQTLQQLLKSYNRQYILNVGPGGTVMRFLTAFLAVQPQGEWLLTGSERMLQRPIGVLTGALRHLGAHISYVGNEGYPPLHIHGNTIHGGKVQVDGGISSQYITGLLLVAPQLKDGLEMHLQGDVTSKPYISMTLNLMHLFGASVSWQGNVITVKPQPYNTDALKDKSITVEADWSGASYWYSLVALSQSADIHINGLQPGSLQGDAVLVDIFDKLGVHTAFTEKGVHLSKKPRTTTFFEYDFSACPDIAQTVAVVLAGLGLEGTLTGLHTLKIKETDRVNAVVTELNKLGYNAGRPDNNKEAITIRKGKTTVSPQTTATYEDHRMAMAFAPLALVCGNLQIEHPEVVGKSYPEYWDHLKSVGFSVA